MTDSRAQKINDILHGLLSHDVPSYHIDEAEESILALFDQAKLEARIEQIMQDFMSLTASYFPELDEQELITWREDSLADLKSQGDS